METPNKNAAGGNRTAFLNTQPQYNAWPSPRQDQKWGRSKLPNPIWVLDKLKVRYRHRPTWIQIHCPFHGNGQEHNPSMGMDARDGHYRCHACGAKGGDVIAFYRAVTGKSFSETLKDLGVYHG